MMKILVDHDEKYEVTFGLQDQCRPMLVDHDEEYEVTLGR